MFMAASLFSMGKVVKFESPSGEIEYKKFIDNEGTAECATRYANGTYKLQYAAIARNRFIAYQYLDPTTGTIKSGLTPNHEIVYVPFDPATYSQEEAQNKFNAYKAIYLTQQNAEQKG